VYGIVKQSGGYIWVYSELGHGTTFKLYFPTTTATLERSPLRTDGATGASGQLLLVVEDEPAIRANMRECLQHLGYRVLEAENGIAALRICEEVGGQIDLVLTDLVMAGKSGHELASELAQRYPKIRVLFMSGYTQDSATRRDILLQGGPFLQKPFSVADLAKAVRDALVLIPEVV
jgi:two-component system cell cycle sensor histidine kinase/response regulator CckA